MQIDFPEHGLAPDLDRPEIMPSLRVVLGLEHIKLPGRLHRLGHEAVTGPHERTGHMHPALYGLHRRHPEACELAERVVLRGDHTRIRAFCLGLYSDGHWALL